MSAESSDSNNPILSFIGNVFLFLVPVALIVMLGIVGAAFVSGIIKGDPKKKAEAVAAVAAPAPSAVVPAPSTSGTASTSPETHAAPAGGGGAVGIDPAVMALGKTSYALCAACHGSDGAGLKVGAALMAPSMVGSEVLLGDPDRPLLVVLKGIAKENMDFMGMMAPLGAALDDQKLAAVLTYVRNEWGNSAPAVTVEQAAAARAKFADVVSPAGVKRTEIEQIVAAHK